MSAKHTAEHMANRAAESTGGMFPSAAMWRKNWPTYLMYGAAGFGALFLGQWAVTGKRPHMQDMVPSFIRRQEHKVDEALHDVRHKAQEVRDATIREARAVGSTVQERADDVRNVAIDKARDASAAVKGKADDVRSKLDR